MKDKPHVLIVDDEPNVRRVLGTLLEQAGYATTRAASGEQALDLVRAKDPDLVMTDLRMDGMDGMELLSRMRSSFPEIPVVMLTAHGTVENAVEAMKRGALDFLTKPFDRDQVTEIVGKAVAQAESGRREYRGPLVAENRCGLVGNTLDGPCECNPHACDILGPRAVCSVCGEANYPRHVAFADDLADRIGNTEESYRYDY